MTIHHDAEGNRFCLYDEAEELAGEIVYQHAGDGILHATHTNVLPQHEGKGYAAVLLDALCAWAVAQNLKIVPVCSYVVRAFSKRPEKYASVIVK